MMQTFCAPSATDKFAARLLADTDCQAAGLVERGYAALSAPGGTVSIALTGLMIIAVALFGYRLLLGRGILLADAMSLTIKLGIVMVLASSWDSWSALAYQGLAKAPTQIAGELLTGIGAGDPIASLDRMLDSLAQAAVGLVIQQHHVVAGFGHLQRRRDAGDAATDHQDGLALGPTLGPALGRATGVTGSPVQWHVVSLCFWRADPGLVAPGYLI